VGTRRREAGILLPLFALRSKDDWGVGEIGAVPAFCTWLAGAGHRRLQLLPFFEMAPGERSPYAGLTAFAIDPIYLSLGAVEDFVAAGGEEALAPADRAALATARLDPHLAYDAVRRLKHRALQIAFARFHATEWIGHSRRARALESFQAAEEAWLPAYVLFRACRESREERPWPSWEPALRDRDPAALSAAEKALAPACLFHAYVQWVAAEQWLSARRAAAALGVALDGDLPFVVGTDSVDVWTRQDEFRLDAALGAPPDAFNAAGQNWGLPPCRWDAMATGGFTWLRRRLARMAALFDGCRVDHVVGYYRMYVRPGAGSPAFDPRGRREQRILGERLLGVMRTAARDLELTAEDLGVVPDFVRASLRRLDIPGYRVLRWEADGGVFRDPRTYPARSVATTGTHDTSSLATWWEEELDEAGRQALAAVPGFAPLRDAGCAFDPAVQTALLDGLYGAASDLVVLPFPDLYGGRERINVPATVGPTNWAYRMPWLVEQLTAGAGRELGERLRALAARRGRA
jgi:4-alpha-glucanotransferase